MTCLTADRLRLAYYGADPFERDARRAELSAHLKACPACRAELDADAKLEPKPHDEVNYDDNPALA